MGLHKVELRLVLVLTWILTVIDNLLSLCIVYFQGKTETVTQCGFGSQRAILVAGQAYDTLASVVM